MSLADIKPQPSGLQQRAQSHTLIKSQHPHACTPCTASWNGAVRLLLLLSAHLSRDDRQPAVRALLPEEVQAGRLPLLGQGSLCSEADSGFRAQILFGSHDELAHPQA